MADYEGRANKYISNRERGMERIIRLLWVIVILLVILIAKDSIPRKADADYRQSVNISAIGGSSVMGKTLDVRIVK